MRVVGIAYIFVHEWNKTIYIPVWDVGTPETFSLRPRALVFISVTWTLDGCLLITIMVLLRQSIIKFLRTGQGFRTFSINELDLGFASDDWRSLFCKIGAFEAYSFVNIVSIFTCIFDWEKYLSESFEIIIYSTSLYVEVGVWFTNFKQKNN